MMGLFHWVYLVMALALLQFLVFGVMVGRARGTYNIQAPATTGHEMFERMYRVHMNTLELLVCLIPGMFIAAQYWRADVIAAVGVVYLVGRFIYWRSYIADPAKRTPGFALSVTPVLGLVVAIVVGAVRALLQTM